MPFVTFQGHSIGLQEGETVLEAVLRSGIAIPHACRAGACRSCLMRTIRGNPTEAAQAGLRDTLRARGYFLACMSRPTEDLQVESAGDEVRRGAQLVEMESLSHNVLRVHLRTAEPIEYRPGQFITLLRPDGLARSYSLASLPHEDRLELHVRLLPHGRMSQWLHAEAQSGDPVWVQGPDGDCFYMPGQPEQPLLLAGTGTGLAPLYGIVRDALAHGHTGPIRLFHGALDPSGLYLGNELRALEAAHPQFRYIACVLNGEAPGLVTGPIDKVIAAHVPQLKGWRGFLCGDPAIVTHLRKRLFLSGMNMRDIHADSFTPSAAA
jgi:CDP-4-dehydro-6-deoxyglucose reductase, E3